MAPLRTFGRRQSAELTLVCFPYAGGTAALFKDWHRHLPEVQVSAVRLPGRGERIDEPAITEWPEMVGRLSAALFAMITTRFVFFGHSFGALLCFEVARWLRRHRGVLPAHLFVAGRSAPHVPDTAPPTWDRSDDHFVRRLRELKGTPPEILENSAVVELLVPRLRADFKLVDTYSYVPEPPFACPITAFGGADDEETQEGRLEAWREHTTGRFTACALPGDHFFIHSRERELLASIRTDLLRCLHRPSAAAQRMQP